MPGSLVGGKNASLPRERAGRVWVVLHLSPRKRGSMEQQLVAVARGLRREGVGVTYVVAAPPPLWLAAELADAGAEVRALALGDRLAPLQLGAWLRAARPPLVHFHFVRAYSPLVAAARLCGATVVVNDHVTLTRAGGSRLREAAKRARAALLNPLVDVRVAVSRTVAESVRTIEHAAAVEVLENGIELQRFSADGAAVRRELAIGARPLIACVSRLSAEKGVESAIRMMPLVRREATLALVGDGPMEPRWRALAAELGVGAAVRFLGVRDDVPAVLAASDVVVVPSHWEEAFGLAVVEGMAAARPVVVTRSGAMPELVGDAGLVVPKRDPAALAGAVTRLLDDPRLRQRFGRAARRRAEARFGMERYVARVAALYRRRCPSLFVGRAA
jgi:glycosyltransferase involved in cell wall biosynthesis